MHLNLHTYSIKYYQLLNKKHYLLIIKAKLKKTMNYGILSKYFKLNNKMNCNSNNYFQKNLNMICKYYDIHCKYLQLLHKNLLSGLKYFKQKNTIYYRCIFHNQFNMFSLFNSFSLSIISIKIEKFLCKFC